MSDLNTVAL